MIAGIASRMGFTFFIVMGPCPPQGRQQYPRSAGKKRRTPTSRAPQAKRRPPKKPPFRLNLERVMGIESKPAPLLSNQPLTRRLGRNFDTLGDTLGSVTVAHTLCLHQRPRDVIQTRRGPFGAGPSGPSNPCVGGGGCKLCSKACLWLMAATFSLLCSSF